MDQLDKQLAQFVNNPSFRRYVLKQSEEDVNYWENWQDANPEKQELLDRARAVVQLFQTTRWELAPSDIDQHWQSLEQQLETAAPGPAARSRILRLLPVILVAAACIALVAIWVFPGAMQQFDRQKRTIYTEYGEKRTVTLPDGSEIVMNANSSLSYFTPWDSNLVREVWYSGEGFFDIAHDPEVGADQFHVHLDQVKVEVLGTSFNINSRHNKTQVVLQEGKVQLTRETNEDTLLMSPGELVEYADNELFIRRKVDPVSFIAWTENRIVFEENTLRSIGEMIVDRYGLNVEIVGNEAFARRTFSGEAIVENLDDFILLLESFDIVIEVADDRMVIREPSR